ncbi:MAG: hypothetical protein M1828_003869 [Chrysothrix sp. TS-e1954]|nr:MAG: hypothetical protein M1828_003869 [Chrysothrix sp. TS-e1954]
MAKNLPYLYSDSNIDIELLRRGNASTTKGQMHIMDEEQSHVKIEPDLNAKPQTQTNKEYEPEANTEATTTVQQQLQNMDNDPSESEIRPDTRCSPQPQVASERAPEKNIKSKCSTPASAPKEGPQPPVRVLVQSLTHLVRGEHRHDDGHQRVDLMLDSICRYHWKCDFTVDHFRAAWHGRFAFNGKRCFFLIDYGDFVVVDEDVPVLYYEWTGDAFVHAPGMARDPKIREYLTSKVPFIDSPSEPEERPKRKVIKSRLYHDEPIADPLMEHMVDHPEDVEWLEKHLRPRFWMKFKRLYDYKKYGFTMSDEFSRPIDPETWELLEYPT